MRETVIDSGLNLDNSYAVQLKGLYVFTHADQAPAAQLIKFNVALATELGFDLENLSRQQLCEILSAESTSLKYKPLSQAYAGHQFGHFNPQLGDGRALLLAEVLDINDQRRDIHLKGSGRTVFSRRGDGKAVLGPVLREYLMAEAMHKLQVPTTRALAVLVTGEKVMREQLLPGAIFVRVASSHIRIGTFQYLAARNDIEQLKILADYSIARHYPQIADSENPYLELLRCVCQSQAALIAKWMSIGFVHGVMNTDNLTISGETIDYGPCAFLDEFTPSIAFSSIDQQSRYAYENQPAMALWGVTRLAEALLPLLDTQEELGVKLATDVLDAFDDEYQRQWLEVMGPKLGLVQVEQADTQLINDLLVLMSSQKVDFTLLFRSLADAALGDASKMLALFNQHMGVNEWLNRWQQRIAKTMYKQQLADDMNKINPLYIPRNHKVEEALAAAQNEADFEPFNLLLDVLNDPYTQRQGLEKFERRAGNSNGYKTFCGT